MLFIENGSKSKLSLYLHVEKTQKSWESYNFLIPKNPFTLGDTDWVHNH